MIRRRLMVGLATILMGSTAGCSGSLSVQTAPLAEVRHALPATSTATSSDCVIKGNINSKGEHIYHVPGARYYDETKIDESKGERWFCSESEAQDAGWRKAKV